MDDRYNNSNFSAPETDYLDNKKLDVPRSAFDFSCMKYFPAHIGSLIPFDVVRTLPNEDYTISYDILAKLVDPLVRPLLTGMRIYVHTYYNRCTDLWEGANNFFTKGRSGTLSLELPYITDVCAFPGGDEPHYSFVPTAPSSYMGLPVEYSSGDPLDSFKPVIAGTKIYSVPPKINALPFVMYARLYRDKYCPKNLLQNNKKIFPDNEDHFILPYSCTHANVLDYDDPDGIADLKTFNFPTADSNKPLALNALYFRQFKGDYFTSASPFIDLIRGVTPTIDLSTVVNTVSTAKTTLDWSKVVTGSKTLPAGSAVSTSSLGAIKTSSVSGLSANTLYDTFTNAGSTIAGSVASSNLLSALNKATANTSVTSVSTASGLSLNLNDLRALEAYTIFMERNARTNGDYDSLIQAQFGYNPHQGNREAVYIGGCFQDVVCSDVTQTSSTSDTSALGSKAGQALSAGSGYIGKFHSPDYGYIMSVLSIVPDSVYVSGVDRMWTQLEQSDVYFPILNNLSPQPILNKELFVSGDDSVDNDVFGYTERYSEYKSRRSSALSFFSLPDSQSYDFTSYIMARHFSTTPQLNNAFMTLSPDNVDMTPFSSSKDLPFLLSVACRCDKVSPMPYKTIPGGLSARA